jgi:hypothetical protein
LSKVVTNPFEARHEKVAFLEIEGEAIFDIDGTDAIEEVQKEKGVVGPHEAVINNLFAIDFLGTVGEAEAKEVIGFLTDLGHDGSVDGGGIQWAKGHDFPNILEVVRGEKGELLLVRVPDSDLVITGFGVETDKIKGAAGSIAKIIQSVVTAGNRE